ncbi:MAG: menaquinone biosynthesis protein [Ferruginibacter sp.]
MMDENKRDLDAPAEKSSKIRVGAVSYLNTKPLIYGFEKGMMQDEVELVIDYPAKIAEALLENKIDIGLVPVAVLPQMKNPYFVGDFGIACDGPVATVCLFSEVPVEQIETVYLDYQSRTSVGLLKILLRDFWKISPRLVNATAGYEDLIAGNTAGLVIGDRAFKQKNESKYCYDLGLAWKQMTGLPFVFAAWISNKQLSGAFKDAFNKSNELGLANIDKLVAAYDSSLFNLSEYYSENIKFRIKDNMLEVIQLFLEKLKTV